ncbi:MAG: hypothetical protein CXT67_00135 [Methanobacteriota archaeon]|nr:MAG: hypothetical protein CXT67_00135 [Euryarchaeota archaeon]
MTIHDAWAFLKEEVRLRGSTGAGLRTLPNGKRVVVKRGGFAGGNPAAHINNEFDMNRYLNKLGLAVPNAEMVEERGRPTMLTDFEEGARNVSYDDKKRLREDFVPQALIGNWDALGADMDNVLMRPDGTPTYVDVGGAGPYRAQGAPKGQGWGSEVSELQSMQYKPPHTEEVYGQMTPEEMGQSYDKHGGSDAMNAALSVLRNNQTRDIMQQRIGDVARQVA